MRKSKILHFKPRRKQAGEKIFDIFVCNCNRNCCGAYFLMPSSTEKDIEIYYGESELFSQDELESAADLVLAQFRNIENTASKSKT